MNECGACGEDFAGVEDFDAHRVGKHEYTFWEGMAMQPSRANGRRCLARLEMVEDGWGQNAYGRWLSPKSVRKQARKGGVFAPRRVFTPQTQPRVVRTP